MRTRLLAITLFLLVASVHLRAATYSVCASGCNYTTLSAANAAAVPGDIFEFENGTYVGATLTVDGTAGNVITYRVKTGHAATINSTITLTNRDYITIGGTGQGFTITAGISAACSAQGSFLTIRNNTITNASGNIMISLCADDVLISDNTATGAAASDDFANVYGSRIVVRNNVFQNALDPANHVDFFQSNCFALSNTIASNYLLLENNRVENNTDANSHFYLNNLVSGDCPTTHATNIVIRHNQIDNIGSGFLYDVNVDKHKAYNNTILDALGSAGWTVTWNSGGACTGCTLLNNLFKDAIGATGDAAVYYLKSGDGTSSGNYNLACGRLGTLCPASVTWLVGQIGGEANGVRNQDPLLTGYTPEVTSPAIDAGGPLTTVAAADTGSGTSIVLTDAAFFQPGWAGTAGDFIAVGTVGNTVQISSINYGTNTATLAGSIARNDGDSVWLYKDSDGTIVLKGSAPDIGAVEYQPAAPVITTASPLPSVTVNTAYSTTISGTCTNTPCTWTSDIADAGACTGITFTSTNSTMATMGGTPTVTGTCSFNATTTDTLSLADTDAFIISVESVASGSGGIGSRLRGVIR